MSKDSNEDVTTQVTEALALLNDLTDERDLSANDLEKIEAARALLASIL